MFSFFKSAAKDTQNAFSFIQVDMHNHLLPAIDDGSDSVSTSLILMEGLQDLGYTAFACTPHVINSVHPNTPQTIAGSFSQLRRQVSENGNPVKLAYSAEYMIEQELEEIIANGNIVPLPGNYVLVEMSFALASPNIKEVLFKLQVKGFTPILAHPERYTYLYKSYNTFESFRDAGAELQLNLLSIQGYYGKPIKAMAEKLLKDRQISWLGTDLHHVRHLEALQKLATDSSAMKQLRQIKELKNPSLNAFFTS